MNLNNSILPLGKLSPDLLSRILAEAPNFDSRLLLAPGIGIDCSIIDLGDRLLAFKSDPITFVTDEIGWYAVQVCANDIITTGALPRWFLPTILLPQGKATETMVTNITSQIFTACRNFEISVIGGHTEITYGIDRPIIIGTLIGELAPGSLVTPRGAKPGHRLLLTKGVPLEATAILAREFSSRLSSFLTTQEIKEASSFLYDPGISVVKDARLAMAAGRVTAMHDPTEGGLAAALWEMAEASGHAIHFNPESVYIPSLSRRICDIFNLDPMSAIASGSLLLAAPLDDAENICQALGRAAIRCKVIGDFIDAPPAVWYNSSLGSTQLPRPDRDEVTKVFEV